MKGFPKTAIIGPLFFLVGVLALNAVSATYTDRMVIQEELASKVRGGPIEDVPGNSSALSGSMIVPNARDISDELPFLISDAAVTGPSTPLTNLTPLQGGIKKYSVRSGDTLSSIASQFGISIDTVRWANPDITWSIRKGQELTILPVSGVAYSVQPDDTVESIAGSFKISEETVKQYNPEYQRTLSKGEGTLVLAGTRPQKGASYANLYGPGLPDLKGYFQLPAAGWNWGQLHEHNAVDIANQCGTPVNAAAEGAVIPDDRLGDGTSGWNEGYGMFVLIEHPNGTRTRYAHLGAIKVAIGAYVQQGDQIGEIGKTGNTDGPTGCHVHLEVYNAKNPFAVKQRLGASL